MNGCHTGQLKRLLNLLNRFTVYLLLRLNFQASHLKSLTTSKTEIMVVDSRKIYPQLLFNEIILL